MFWSNALAQVYLREIPDSALLAAWSDSPQESETGSLRHQLALWSQDDAQIREWIAAAWRTAHGQLVKATERLSPEEIGALPPARFEDLGTDRVLLAVLSEVAEDTAQDVQQILRILPRGRARSLLRARWAGLQDPAESRPTKHIALIGGHPSESPRVRALEQKLNVQFKWTVAEKSKGLSPGHNALGDLESIEAMIIVTGNVGHSTMHCARKASARIGVPCRYVKALNQRSLQECLESLHLEGSH